MNKQKKILCVLIAAVLIIGAAFCVANSIKENKLKAQVISDEDFAETIDKLQVREILYESYDHLWVDALYSSLGHTASEYIGLTDYAYEKTGKTFEVVTGLRKYGVTDIYFIPYADRESEEKIYRYNFDDTLELVWSDASTQSVNALPQSEIKESLYYKFDDKISEVLFYNFGYETAEHLGCTEEKISGIDIDYDLLEVFHCLKGDEDTYCLVPSVDGKLILSIYVCYSDNTAELLWTKI